jgi:hypothetical protein
MMDTPWILVLDGGALIHNLAVAQIAGHSRDRALGISGRYDGIGTVAVAVGRNSHRRSRMMAILIEAPGWIVEELDSIEGL